MTAIERLCEAIGYPAGETSAGGRSATLQVDGIPLRVRVENGRLVFERSLPAGEPGSGALARLAGYAAGRILKEEAVLAWDPEAECPILWQDVSESASAEQLKIAFEVFCASCDWWLARADEAGGERVVFPEMMIRP